METDEMLYAKFRAGDHQALEDLIGIHKETLTLFIHSYVQDLSEAENLMIDAFAQLVVSKKGFQGKSSLKTYLFAIGRNLALGYLKKNRRHLSLDTLHLAEDAQAFDVFRKDRNRQLYTAMESLVPQYRSVLFLLYFENMTYLEAGTVMKKNEKQVTNLAYRAKKALKEQLEQEGFVYHE